MTSFENDVAEISGLLDAWATRRAPLLTVSPPIETLVGELDPDGWGEWRMIPSPVTSEDIRALETAVGVKLPPFYEAFLRCRVLLDLDFGDYTLPRIWPRDSLSEVQSTMASRYGTGYLTFGSARGCGDPLCFAVEERCPDGDFPVVVFNHDVVPKSLLADAVALRDYAGAVAPSFRDFLPSLLLADASIFPPPESPEENRRNEVWTKIAALLKERGLPPRYRPPGVDPRDPRAILRALEAAG